MISVRFITSALSAGLALGCAPDGSAAKGGPDAARAPDRPAVFVAAAPTVFRLDELDVIAQNDACERCHVEIAAEWQSSLHRASWSNEVFLGAYVVEPIAFCRGCHAPEALISDANDPARHLGVGCVTCHVEGHDIVGARAVSARVGAHAVVETPAIRGVGWCASCHQFEFPVPQDAAMQSTVEEHAASPQADKSCQSCHMPVLSIGGRSHLSHTFRVHGDPAILRRSLEVSARRGPTDRSLVVALKTTPEVGHAVPTGDMFRRLEVRARATTQGREQTSNTIVLAREFRMEQSAEGLRRVQIGDSRVPATGEAREALLQFPSALGEGDDVEWTVVYRRMGPSEAALFGVDLAAEEVLIASGRLPAADAH